ncbi:hypothetical protein CKK33_02995 [Mucilaginibacter sp. MD40]|uniref:hypothetical protein n=1 Tax=Mucilaginibacter sp. MD40 TaxID=2029590 RepID=UPI000BACAADD|nr:hypothetical protein [Mucilaginibacter sp. MD40]PAW92516.1 hypothetical protein CKK33_02995 [Mucilaginibacter sp. MD40]
MKKFDRLSREEMKQVLGGYAMPPGDGGSVTLSCSCTCNSGIGTQPSFTLDVSNYDSSKSYVPGASACNCSTIYFAAQPGYNSGSCSRIYEA